MNMNYSYPTTIYESISAQINVFLVKILLTIFAKKAGMVDHCISFVIHYYCCKDTNLLSLTDKHATEYSKTVCLGIDLSVLCMNCS